MALSKRIMKLLKQKYGKKPGVKVGDASKIRKQLGGTQVPSYRRAKDGGYIVKKKKKVVKKRKK
jgi:hypothetical protein